MYTKTVQGSGETGEEFQCLLSGRRPDKGRAALNGYIIVKNQKRRITYEQRHKENKNRKARKGHGSLRAYVRMDDRSRHDGQG